MVQSHEIAPHGPEAEARHATVLKCDLVGSTRTKAPLDLDGQLAFQRGFERLVRDVAARHSAHIVSFEGDGALMVFGLPQPREDAAELAVRMACQLVEAVSAAKIVPDVQLQVRVGVASGPIAVVKPSSGPRGEMIAGLTIDMAERLRALAEPGEIVISDTTKQLAAGYFRYEDLGAVQAKGFDEGVRAWRVLGASPVVSRLEARLVGKQRGAIVGRTEELARLAEAWASARSGTGQAVCLSGEAGIGKSRLARAALDAAAQDKATTMTLDCTPSTRNTPFYPIGVLLRRTAGIQSATPEAEKQALAKRMLARLLPENETATALAYLAPLFGLEAAAPPQGVEPGDLRDQTIALVVRMLGALAAEQPLAILCEDLHWVDDTTATVIARVCETVGELRALLILTTRPTSDQPPIDLSALTKIALPPLDSATAADLVRAVAGSKPLPEDAVRRIVRRCEGVPLVLEEVTRASVEASERPDAGEDADSEGEVPPPLQLAVEARLGRWPRLAPILQSASVAGREFSRPLLEKMVPETAQPHVQEALDVFAQEGLFTQHQAGEGRRVRFKHAMVCEAVYNTLLRSDRQRLHSRIADILLADYVGAPDGAPDLVAEHLRKARRCAESIRVRLAAAADTAARGAYVESGGHCAAALALIPEVDDPAERRTLHFQLLIQRGVALSGEHGYSAPIVEEAYRQALSLCGDSGEAGMLYPIMRGLATINLLRGDHGTAYELSMQALKLAEQSQQAAFRIDAMSVLCWTALYSQPPVESRRWIGSCLQLYRAEQGHRLTYPASQDAAAAAVALLPTVAWLVGDAQGAEDALRDGLAHVERLGRDFERALLYSWAAGMRYMQRRYAEALEHATTSLKIAQQHGYRSWEAQAGMVALMAQAALAPDPAVAAQARGVAEALLAEGVRCNAPYFLWGVARGYAEAGDHTTAREIITQALELAEQTQELRLNAELMILQAELETDDARAAELLTQARTLSEERGEIATALRAEAARALRTPADRARRDYARASLDMLDSRVPWPSERDWMQQRLTALDAGTLPQGELIG